MNNNAVLCYVDDQWAYFTTQKLSDQWGDDWNDAPYEHNAGEPYGYIASHDTHKTPWEIIKVAWEGDLDRPDSDYRNSPYSVEQINAGAVPWLKTSEWHHGPSIVISAGTRFSDFCDLVLEAGGMVYLPIDQ